jgi:hypothetical protein
MSAAAPAPVASSSGAATIGISGTFTLRADETTRPRTIAAQRSYAFDASHAATADAAAAAAASAAAAAAATAAGGASAIPAAAPKPARVTANTTAVFPSDIPRVCSADPALSQLVTLLRLAKEESDRWLTEQLDDMKKQRQCKAATSHRLLPSRTFDAAECQQDAVLLAVRCP